MIDCLTWRGSRYGNGYGRTFRNGKAQPAHRVAYELFKGAIPAGLVIDHLCRNPLCFNPEHLEAVTERENILRGTGASARNARKTHCPRGHAFTPENTYNNPRGFRVCRECHRAKCRLYRAQRSSK